MLVGIAVLGGLLAVGAVVLLVMVSANPPTAHTVRFEVSAPSGKVTLVNWSTVEDSALVRNPVSPWSHEVELESATGIVGVNVSGTGTVACRVWVDGKLVDEGESSGAVHCGATVR
ncbi:MmpS family transport accessory protein [Plantactinospora sp. WMMB782]|uniref:MmpS family transport accessory protein n=1 Tax=Plantactinospora sp. WMMB782 TaxID=3404121 RepID=UPI003B9263F4